MGEVFQVMIDNPSNTVIFVMFLIWGLNFGHEVFWERSVEKIRLIKTYLKKLMYIYFKFF
jgi:hypothetical protein